MSRSNQGFSVLELLVVLVIIGIVAAVSGIWYGAAQPAAVKGTVTSIYGLLSEARTTARSTGRTVTLTTSGALDTLAMTFPTQGDDPANAAPVLTSWLRAAQGTNATKYAAVDTDGTFFGQASPSPDPLAGAEPAIKSLFTAGANPTAANQLFNGATNVAMSFDSTGKANKDFYVFVAGTRNGSSYLSAPVGLVLVTRANGVHAFYKPNSRDATVPWQRL